MDSIQVVSSARYLLFGFSISFFVDSVKDKK